MGKKGKKQGIVLNKSPTHAKAADAKPKVNAVPKNKPKPLLPGALNPKALVP